MDVVYVVLFALFVWSGFYGNVSFISSSSRRIAGDIANTYAKLEKLTIRKFENKVFCGSRDRFPNFLL